jgi:Na+-transporting methylmalonyl-CoA/oxaloacetate decarboxylase gamma subunit
MITHTIVFAVLSILSAIAIYAVGKPISKSSSAQHAPDSDETRDVVPGATFAA